MKPFMRLVGVGLFAFASSASGQTPQTGGDAAVSALKAELEASRAETARLKADAEKYIKHIDGLNVKIRTLESEIIALQRRLSGEIDKDAVQRILLPENPTRDQIKEYVKKIIEASELQTRFSEMDPQVFKLQMLGRENLDLLIDMIPDANSKMYFMAAITFLSTQADKDMIIGRLAGQPALFQLVRKYNWFSDARPALIEGLKKRHRNLSPDWITYIAQLADATTYSDLKWYFVNGSNRHLTFGVIKDLPGIDITADEVSMAWEASKPHPALSLPMANIAAFYGVDGALSYIVQYIRIGYEGEKNPALIKTANEYFAKYTRQSGDESKITKWFDENKSKLVFLEDMHIYVVPDEQPTIYEAYLNRKNAMKQTNEPVGEGDHSEDHE